MCVSNVLYIHSSKHYKVVWPLYQKIIYFSFILHQTSDLKYSVLFESVRAMSGCCFLAVLLMKIHG